MATRTAPHPPASAPPVPPACQAPPATFGRLAQEAGDLHIGVRVGRLSGQPRTLSVLLDDPAAAALSLRTHMEPAALMELILILAEAAADVLQARRAIHDLQPRPTRSAVGVADGNQGARMVTA
ncbi:MAG: hypothetical protein ACRDRR_13610 [Pseudonocardiaceae bacterium]